MCRNSCGPWRRPDCAFTGSAYFGGTVARSLFNVSRENLEIDTENVVVFRITPSQVPPDTQSGGASKTQVRTMVFRQIGMASLIGVAVGLVLAAGLGRLAQSLLYQVKWTDPAIFCASTVVLAIVLWVVSHIPARRASQLDPMTLLRYE